MVIFVKYKVVIFIDSYFWHNCPLHCKKPKSNVNYWRKKLIRNVERYREVTEYYHNKDWNIKRKWEHDIKNILDGVVDELSKLYTSKGSKILIDELTSIIIGNILF